MRLNDTIAAIATPGGVGGIAIIRISGTDAVSAADKLAKPYGISSVFEAEDRKLTLCRIFSDETKTLLIDEALIAVMYAPKSYTGETVVEINCHGGYYAAKKILDSLLKTGVRLAEAGEFTRRAFVNGKTDLTRAEAVVDLMNATSDLGLNNSALSLTGVLSKKIGEIRAELLEIATHISAAADYPEEVDIPDSNELKCKLLKIYRNIKSLADGFCAGKLLRDGVRTAIAGRPNVGKSSLLNALLNYERAIVTDVPGTTRDTVEELLNIGGVTLRLIDTAGIHNAEDKIEKIGIEKSVENIKNADLCLFVIDSSSRLSDEDFAISKYLNGKRIILVLNKKDKKADFDIKKEAEKLKISPAAVVETAVLQDSEFEGIDSLKEAVSAVFKSEGIDENSVFISNERQRDALYKAADSVKAAYDGFLEGMPYDLLYIDMEDALAALGEVTGETVREEICDTVFKRFCVGK